MWCCYRGEGFHGYQQQGELRTAQRELLQAFSKAGLTRKPVVAGRTDKGVSARMQVLSARVDNDRTAQSLVPTLNALLPSDLRLHLARDVPDGFHAAWSSISKEYRYTLTDPGDVALLHEAAALIPGTRNFKVFHFKTSQNKPRTVTSVEWLPDTSELRFKGEGFARYMVRMLVGGLMAVSHRELSLDVFRAGLEQQQNFYCATAPAEPLTLWEVGYPEAIDPFSLEDRRAFQWPDATLRPATTTLVAGQVSEAPASSVSSTVP